MASYLLRTSALRGSGFPRSLSGATPAARSGGPRTLPGRSLSRSSANGGERAKTLDAANEKVDEMQRQVQELNQIVDRDIFELVDRYIDYQRSDHGYFERFLTRSGMTKSKYRDDLIWRCQISTLFVLSGGVGYLLSEFKRSKK